MTSSSLSRRGFLLRSGALGCSLAASPLMTPISLAAAPWDRRLVVIILRGGMDGLDVVRPVGDPAFAKLRPSITKGGEPFYLDGFYALHPALGELMPLWASGELGFVHAVSTPYRGKRSHFDGQDMLEAGTATLSSQVRDGWLNRLLQEMPDLTGETAYAIGRGDLRVFDGPAPVSDWTPEADVRLSPQAQRLAELVMEDDPALHAAFAEAAMLSEESRDDLMDGEGRKDKNGHLKVARFAAQRLRGDARIAAFSLNGFDTHANQANALSRSLRRLAAMLLTLRSDLGPDVWGQTAVVAVTEFGRTARENGSGGTDHGTGGLMLYAGGAMRGAQVAGRWPGVSEAALYERRDLMPTMDVRAPLAGVLQGITGVSRSALETRIFPGLEMGDPPTLLR